MTTTLAPAQPTTHAKRSLARVGCGIGRIRSTVKESNFAANNTLILFTNFVVPAFLIYAYYHWA